ncbi:MAG: hypothetical protein N2234_06900 [Planctomycetota bacterium]|nr:hypothetical protein [Planctomycetota bacterium]
MGKEYKMIDLSKLKRYSLKSRKSLVRKEQFAVLLDEEGMMEDFFASLPDVLAVRTLKTLARRIADAAKEGRGVLVMFGAHVLKCGLAPVLLGMAEKEMVSAFATNGASAVHDIEIAVAGRTSEDVGEAIEDGSFGMSEETARLFAEAAEAGVEGGLGYALGKLLSDKPNASLSLFAQAYRLKTPVTVHCAIGTDIVHMHPELNPAALGEATHKDFRKFCSVVADLEGGVVLNIGSAVVMPEVFLKALSVSRNITGKPVSFTAANLDIIHHYRPTQNILLRPKGEPFELIGHHEINLPLLYSAVLLAMRGRLK